MDNAIESIDIPGLKKLKSGKVREVFDLGDQLLICATDRISAFDYILPTLIPKKGEILTQLSIFWFAATNHIIENHFITDDVNAYPAAVQDYKDILRGRSMLVKKAELIEIECVARGYIAGSAWNEYEKTGIVGGVACSNLKKGDKFPTPLFTPATKSFSGHDINISFEEMKKTVPAKDAEYIKSKTIELYNYAHDYALERGIVIADTKFEFGRLNDKMLLIDEIFTPDSSRFWDKELYDKERSLIAFDKQFVRDYLLSTDWNRNSEPPELPPDIVEKTVERYREALKRLAR
ncbi:MAG: phosphoribosylaminoimidazolesuccinocarboxamide synthase [candidate division WOR-3 bacterium]|nr:MAG: phosphoribosylaminoimidazolesuccinocarboxamide synthase [candidate division WOR-3 bacterium]